MAPVREVAFELECFEWADERLEVAGRWKGIGPRRLTRPVLTVETDSGRRKRIVATPGGHLGVAGETWRASFAWPHDPTEITGAALEVGGSLVVDLPLPDKRRRRRRRSATGSAEALGDEALRAEVTGLRGQVERLRAELAARERELIALRAQLDEAAGAGPDVERAGADDRTVEIQRLARENEQRTVQIEQLARERDERAADVERLARERDEARAQLSAGADQRAAADDALAAERARWQAELDELREAFSEAAAEAEEARDRHRAELEALRDELRAERAEIARLTARAAARPPAQLPAPPEPGADAGEPPAGPPTEAMPAPVPEPSGEAPGSTSDSDSDSDSDDGAVPVEAAVLDAPGPLRAGARPVTPPGAEEQPSLSRVPAWLQGGGEGEPGPLHALRARFEGLFGSNGHTAADEPPEDPGVPRPLRTASAARARAEASAAARRSPVEVWALRVLAALVVAILLTAFVLIVMSIA